MRMNHSFLQQYPQVEHWTTAKVLQFQAKVRPDKTAVQFVDGDAYSYARLYAQSAQFAAMLTGLRGSGEGTIATLLPSGPTQVFAWTGAQLADWVFAPFNPELKGALLKHALRLSGAELVLTSNDKLPLFEQMLQELPDLRWIVLSDVPTHQPQLQHVQVLSLSALLQQHQVVQQQPDAAYQSRKTHADLSCLIFTSGTTGPAKAVMMPHAHCLLYGVGTIDNLALTEHDSYYVCMPLFHANGLFMQLYACLLAGATAVIRTKFSASRWLSDIQRYQISHTNLLGVMSEFILRQPVAADERQHQLKCIAAAPASASTIVQFQQRFGVPLVELYGMSEVNIPLFNPLHAIKPGSCGKVYQQYFEVRIADPDSDLAVTSGTVGEIQVRPKLPGGFMSGYFRMPEQTIEAWRNFWFHTGDAGYCDEEGYFFFVDRIKDCIRRRGENLSSYEIEQVAQQFPGIAECAAVAVSSAIPNGEDEVLLIVSCSDAVDRLAFGRYLQQHLPGYAVPGYIRFVLPEEIPKTATNKIIKTLLRQQGLSGDLLQLID